MKKKLFYSFILSFFWFIISCGHTASPEERAMKAASEAAEKSYERLLTGRYDEFLQGRAGADSLPDDYREQLIMAYKQYMNTQQESHGGISSFKVSNAKIDSTLNLIQVFLMLSYGDQTQEEIVVPMIERDGVWKMK